MVAQANRMNEQFREAIERPAELVKEYPLASMLLMFGMGLGVGVILSQTISSSQALWAPLWPVKPSVAFWVDSVLTANAVSICSRVMPAAI